MKIDDINMPKFNDDENLMEKIKSESNIMNGQVDQNIDRKELINIQS